MANGGRIDYTIGFKTDSSGITEVQNKLVNLQNSLTGQKLLDINPGVFTSLDDANSQLVEIKNVIGQVRDAYDGAFDSTTGVTNINKLSQSLRGGDIELDKMKQAFYKLGPEGIKTFNSIINQTSQFNFRLKETNNFLTKMGETLTNTIKWGISSSIMNTFTNSIQQAWGYVQHLDTSLNDIRIVTGKSAEEMDNFAVKANNAATALGAATTEYTEAALIYYQQGLSDEEANARAETTLKAANVTGQTGQEVSEELTAVWNGYKVSAEETELYVDKLAAVAATTASDLEELSTGMSKVASAANNMGVDIDQLNAQLSTIISVTRQAPETAGTALKTIYARMEDLKISGEDEDGVKLGEVSSTLDEVGVHVMDTAGNLRDLGEVIEEVGNKWETWTNAQQSAIAQAIAGKRQYNNLLALFDNWDMYNSALETSSNATGTLQKQQDIYMESTAAHLQQLKTEWEDLYDSTINTDDINEIIDGLTKVLDTFTNFIDAIGGGKTALTGLIALLTQIPGINTVIANQLGSMITKTANIKKNQETWNNLLKVEKQNLVSGTSTLKDREELLDLISKNGHLLTDAQKEEAKQALETLRILGQQKDVLDEKLERSKEIATASLQATENTINEDYALDDDIKGFAEANILSPDANITSNSGIDAVTQVFENQREVISSIGENLEEYKNKISALNEEKQALEEFLNTNPSDDEAQKRIAEYEEKVKLFKEDVQELKSEIKEGLDIVKPTAKAEVEKLNKELDECEENLSDIGVESKDVTNQLNKMTNTANQMASTMDITQKEVINDLKDSNVEAQQLDENLRRAKDSAQDFGDEVKGQAIGQTITNLVGGVTSLATAFQSLSNINNILNDETLSSSEKASQIITSLSFALPMLISGFSNLGTVFTTTTTLLGEVTSGTVFLTAAERAHKISSDAENVSIWEKAAAYAGLTTAAGAWLVVAAAVVAIVGVSLAVAYKKHKKQLEQDAEQMKKNNELQQEHIERCKEEKSKLEDLSNSYNTLLSQREKDADLTAEQKAEAYDLVRAYGDQDLILKTLAGDYADVAGAILEMKKQANLKEMEELSEGIEAGQQYLKSSIIANASLTQEDKAGFDLSGYNEFKWSDLAASPTAQVSIEGIGIGTFQKELQDQFGVTIDKTGHMSYDDVVKLLSANQEDLNKLLDKHQQTATDTVDDIRSLLADNSETIQQIQADQEQYFQDSLDAIGYEYSEQITSISNLADYQSTLTSLTNEIAAKYQEKNPELTDKEARDQGETWAMNFLNGVNEGLEGYEQQTVLQDSILNAMLPSKEDAEEKAKEIKDSIEQAFMEQELELPIHFKIEDEEQRKALAEAGWGEEDSVQTFEGTNTLGETQYANFTPVIVDEQGNVKGVLTSEQLEAYAKMVLSGMSPDVLHLQIGATFDTKEGAEGIKDLTDQFFNAEEAIKSVDEEYEKLRAELEEKYGTELTDKISTLSTAQQEYIAGNVDLLGIILEDTQSVQEAFDIIQSDLDYVAQQDHVAKIQAVLDETSAEKVQEKLQELFDDPTFDVGFTLEDYNDWDEDTQLVTLTQLRREEIDATEEMVEANEERYEAELDYINTLIESKEKSIKDDKLSQEEIEETQEELEVLYDRAAELEELKGLNGVDFDFTEQLEDTAEAIDAVNDSIDDLQSSYQTLEDAVEEYNSQGYLSIDTLQSIMSMDSSYVASLELENGQLSLNDETYGQLLETKINYLKILATEQYMEELEAIAKGEVVTAAQEMDAAEASNVDSIQAVIDKANEGTDALLNYANAKVAGELADGVTADEDAIQEATDAYETKLALIDSLSTQSTSTLLGDTSDSSSSSSSSSSDEPDEEDYLERDVDLYRAINEQLDDIESKLNNIDNIESHSWGADYLETLEEENELLTAQLDLLESKKSTYQSDLASQQSTLSSYGITFSEDGAVMTNAESVLDDVYAEYNSMVDSYNAMSADEQDEYKDTLEDQKDYVEEIEDAIDTYEDAYSDYNSVLEELLDTHYELIENAVNQFNTTIDVHLELDEAETEWNEFWYEVVQDVQDTDFSGLFEESIAKLTTLVGTTGNTSSSQVAELTTHLNDTITEVQKQIAGADIGGGDSIFGDDTALSKEILETYRDSLIDAVTSAKEEIDTMQENYLKALDDAQDKIDEQVEGWEAVGDHIEHNIELIQMVSGSKAFEPLNKQFEQQYKNNLNLIETQKISQDYWKERMEYYEQMMATEEEGSQMYQTYSDALEKASENYRSAVKDLDSAVKQALDDLEEWRKNQVSALEDTLDKALSSGMGLDDMQSEWDLILEKQGMYLDNVERALEMQDLEKDFSDVLDTLTERNDLQQEFLKFQDEELSKLQNKNKLTQYDIDEVRARLEIRKAELALEEAQQNKSNLRLRRDSQGNYTYQYTANAEDTEDAEDGIVSAKREWYELVKKRQEEVAENAIDIGKRIKEAWSEYEQALEDEDQVRADNAKTRYDELIAYEKDMMQEAEKAKQDFYQGTADFFADVNNNNILPIWNTTIEGMINKWSDGGETSFVGAVSQGITDLDNLQQDFSDKTTEILTTAGVNYENLVNDGIDPTTESLEDMNDTNEELNETLDETNSLLDTLESELQDAISAYDSLKDAAVAAIQAANQELETLSQTAITAIDEINNATSTATSAVSATASSASSNSGSSSSGTGTSSSSGTTYKFVKTTSSGSGDTTSSYGALGKIVKVENGVESVEASGDVTYLSQYKRKKGISVTGLATGGYTGEWTNGSEDGRLAFLHQKELVLNESDTENILNAVTAVRDLVGSQGSQSIDIEGISNSIIRSGYITAQVLAQVGTNMLQAIASMVNNNNSEVQNYRNMTVNADFSGVRSADAIYQALMDLDNYGSQQAYSNAPDMNVRY